MNRLWLALGLSLLFHLSQYGILQMSWANLRPNSTPVEVELVEQEKPTDLQHQRQQQFVDNTKHDRTIDDNKEIRFLAEQQQRVEKETKARNFGLNRNAQAQAPKQPQPRPQQQDPSDEPEFVRAIQQQSQTSLPSQIQYQLPNDIAFGEATNLNADAHIYASFYNRVAELFYIRWVQKINSIWNRMSQETKREMAGQVWSTDVEVWLRRNGVYDRGLIMRRSGFKPFDDAGIFAFKDARFFPNPPPEKVDSDGYIRLRYRINIHIR